MNFVRQGFRKLSSDRQTDRIDQNYKPRHFAGGQLLYSNIHISLKRLMDYVIKRANVTVNLTK